MPSSARKKKQIYSLLPLTTRPPVHIVPSKLFGPVRPALLSKSHSPASCRTCKTLQRPRVTAFAQNRFLEAAAGVSSLGEFCDLPGLLLLLRARRAHVFESGAGEGT